MNDEIARIVVRIENYNKENEHKISQKRQIKKIKKNIKKILNNDAFWKIYLDVNELKYYRILENGSDTVEVSNPSKGIRKVINEIVIDDIKVSNLIDLIDLNYESIFDLISIEKDNQNDLIFIYNGKRNIDYYPHILSYRPGSHDKRKKYVINKTVESDETLLFLMLIVYLSKQMIK